MDVQSLSAVFCGVCSIVLQISSGLQCPVDLFGITSLDLTIVGKPEHVVLLAFGG